MDPKPQAASMASATTMRSVGKTITTIGVGMFTLSIILVFVGVSGATLHNVLQLGGILRSSTWRPSRARS